MSSLPFGDQSTGDGAFSSVSRPLWSVFIAFRRSVHWGRLYRRSCWKTYGCLHCLSAISPLGTFAIAGTVSTATGSSLPFGDQSTGDDQVISVFLEIPFMSSLPFGDQSTGDLLNKLKGRLPLLESSLPFGDQSTGDFGSAFTGNRNYGLSSLPFGDQSTGDAPRGDGDKV